MSGISSLRLMGHLSSSLARRKSSSSSSSSFVAGSAPRATSSSRFLSSSSSSQQQNRLQSSSSAAAATNKKDESSSSSSNSSSSFWDMAATSIQSTSSVVRDQSSHYFQTLRWKAANALMTSLSDAEQQKLVERLDLPMSSPTNNNPPDTGAAEKKSEKEKNDDEQSSTTVLSVAEAAAAARVHEAMKAEATTNKAREDREELWRQAQQAAQARVETEITVLQHHAAAAQTKEDEAAESTNTNSQIIHSILGECVYDLGYKRCHVVSANQLTSIPVWEKQRIYRHDRAKSMAKDKAKTLHLGMPGVISLHEDVQGNLSILDGQHRVGMMAILDEQQQKQQGENNVNGDGTLDLTRILVEVYPERQVAESSSSEGSTAGSHAADLFVEINKAEPVKLVDLPGMGAKKGESKVINHGAQLLQEAYPAMFSASQRCRVPHLNLDNLRDALFQAGVVSRLKIKSAKALEKWLLQQNDVLRQKYHADHVEFDKSWNISKSALEKARKYDFYLGLESKWIYHQQQ